MDGILNVVKYGLTLLMLIKKNLKSTTNTPAGNIS